MPLSDADDALAKVERGYYSKPRIITTPTTTFEIDWAMLDHAAAYGDLHSDRCDSGAVVTEYQRQLTEAGYVIVRREDVMR